MQKIINILTHTFILLFILFLINKNILISEAISFSISLWKDNILPNLFPFFILSNFLIEYNLIKPINKIIAPVFKHLFNLSKEYSYILLISIISGYPSSSKYIYDLLEKKLINIDDANRLLAFTCYSNPLFVLGFIAVVLNKKLSIIIYISHILAGIITGIILNRRKHIINSYNIYKEKINISIGSFLKESITNSINTLFYLLGIIIVFSIITTFIKETFNLNNYIYTIISSILEMSQGIKNISLLNINIYIKTILIAFTISFSGLSIHAQIFGILSKYKIKYKYFLISRIIHSIISIILVSILLYLIY